MLLACAGSPDRATPTPQRSILLVTFEGLRADAVGALGGPESLTPALDSLAREASWGGTAIAPSSDPAASLASIVTGLRPWQHQALAGGRLSAAVPTLASRLRRLGYGTTAYVAGQTVRHLRGVDRGFDSIHRFADGVAAVDHLSRLGDEPELIWVHLRLPATPFVRRDSVPLRELPGHPTGLPERVRARDLERYFDPTRNIPGERREKWSALYQHNVAAADFALGRLLGALEAGAAGPEVAVAALGVHGQELGEHRQTGQGGNLGRASIEVPLFLRLPASVPPRDGPRDSRPESRRVVATLLELAAGEAPLPGLGASLFAATEAGAVSELYAAGGLTEISLVDGDLQLRKRVRFALDGDYFKARRALAGWPETPPAKPASQVFPPLLEAFENLPSWTGGGGRTRNLLFRWTDDEVEALPDPALAARMEARLAVLWDCFTVGNRRPAVARTRLENRRDRSLE